MNKKTSIQSIYALILKETRLIRGFSQKRLAVAIDTSQAGIAKFESGSLSIPFENLIKISYLFTGNLWEISQVAERVGMWLEYFHDYSIYLEKLPQEKDDLMILANEFYRSDIYKNVAEFKTDPERYGKNIMKFPVANNQWAINKSKKDSLTILNVFRYVTNENFRNGKIVPYGRWDHQVIYDEIDDVEKVIDFFSKEKISKNRELFIKKITERSLVIPSVFNFND